MLGFIGLGRFFLPCTAVVEPVAGTADQEACGFHGASLEMAGEFSGALIKTIFVGATLFGGGVGVDDHTSKDLGERIQSFLVIFLVDYLH